MPFTNISFATHSFVRSFIRSFIHPSERIRISNSNLHELEASRKLLVSCLSCLYASRVPTGRAVARARERESVRGGERRPAECNVQYSAKHCTERAQEYCAVRAVGSLGATNANSSNTCAAIIDAYLRFGAVHELRAAN